MKLSIGKILLNDYPSSLAGFFISVLWLIRVFSPDARDLAPEDPGITQFFIIVTVLLSAVLVWRVLRTSRLFRFGRVASARITSVWIPRRGPITFFFAFEHEGRRIRAHMHVLGWKISGWKRVPPFERGEIVQALYDPSNPSRAIIPQLFQA